MLALLPLLVAVRAIKIHPGGSNQFCLEAQGAHANGIAVIINQCSDSMYQEWAISPGSTIVQLAGQNYCLDAGSGEHSQPIPAPLPEACRSLCVT